MNIIKSDFAKTFSVCRKFDKIAQKIIYLWFTPRDARLYSVYGWKLCSLSVASWDILKVQNWILSYFYDKWLLKVKLINNILIKQLNKTLHGDVNSITASRRGIVYAKSFCVFFVRRGSRDGNNYFYMKIARRNSIKYGVTTLIKSQHLITHPFHSFTASSVFHTIR